MSLINFFYSYYLKLKRNYYADKVKRKVAKYGNNLKVNNSSNVTSNTYLGNNVNFNGITIQGKGKVSIGSNFHSGIGLYLITDIHNYDHGIAIPYDDSIISKDITIKDNVWLGNRVMILPGVTIEEGAIIQAGSVVVNNIPKHAIAGGHPAKVFKYRDINHYEKLKKENKFH
ncbi:acyltransferase [Methanobrevibacter filiformis]|uniref:Maltose O-acetyltransferase n=1 Tax=Methanobrevibacter filiformis TaxID=55758 RepID=A0A166A558_9EURY|nr:acyltransferase [Methanobrevibacter filiformis]KZX11583.1 maltose O-acetyltransferase [Methanobrevibacter filiformis]